MAKRASFVRQQSAEICDSTPTLVAPVIPASSMESLRAMSLSQPDTPRRPSIYSLHSSSLRTLPGSGKIDLLVPESTVPDPRPRVHLLEHIMRARELDKSSLDSPTSLSPTTQRASRRRGLIKWIRRPILPVLHLFLIWCHLGLATAVPIILVSNLVQPLVLWLILIVVLILQIIYLLPGLVPETIGIMRDRPVTSAWLQSGLHVTFLILMLLPQALAIGLLSVAEQLPACASIWNYVPLDFPTFLSALPGSPCQGLPAALKASISDAAVVLVELVLSITAIQLDLQTRQREQKKALRQAEEAGLVVEVVDRPLSAAQALESVLNPESEDGDVVKIRRVQRRWRTGVGELLGNVERDLVSR